MPQSSCMEAITDMMQATRFAIASGFIVKCWQETCDGICNAAEALYHDDATCCGVC